MAYQFANNIRICYETFGEPTNPPFILIHGLGGSKEQFHGLAEHFSENHYVILYDCRAHGETDSSDSFTLVDHAKDLIGLMDALHIQKANLLGYSMGSYIAGQAACLFPKRFEKLILCVTRTYDDGCGSSVNRLISRNGLKEEDVSEKERVEMLVKAVWAPQTVEKFISSGALLNELVPTALLTPDAPEFRAINQAVKGFDLRSGYAKINIPTLVISGKYDGINPPVHGKEAADLIPNSTFVLFEKSAHMLQMEESKKFRKVIKRFLEGSVE